MTNFTVVETLQEKVYQIKDTR